MNEKSLKDFGIVGQRIPNIDAHPKSLGQTQYVDDMRLPNMLHGGILGSPFPHAKVRHVDVSRARALAGVKAVLTGQDIPDVIFGEFIGGELGKGDHYALALDKVRHVGDAVAAVAAVDEETAQEALQLIKVEYEPLPAVFDPLEAMRTGAPLIHEKLGSNICDKVIRSFGDVERGFIESDYVREDTYHTMANNHAALEPHGIVAQWHADGAITLWSSSQKPFVIRAIIAKALGLPEVKIRVINLDIGGAFGGKLGALSFQFLAPLLSRVTGRPVKIVLNREEVFHSTWQRHPMVIKIKTGVRKDGTLVGQEIKTIADCGAYRGLGPVILNINAVNRSVLTYIISNYRYEGCRVMTNKPVGGPQRGHGAPQHRFAVESQIDVIARDLGLDPVEMRLKNLIYAGYRHPLKLYIPSCGLKEAIEKVVKALDWKERKNKLPGDRGMGLACSAIPCYPRPIFRTAGSLIIEINADGGVNILSGATDIGQGTKTAVCQIVAEELGVRMEDVHIMNPDTATSPFDVGTFSSGVTFRVGNAAVNAAQEVKRKILEVVAPHLEASAGEMAFRNGKVFVRGHEDKGITFPQAVRIYHYAGKPMPLVAHGYYVPETEVVPLEQERDIPPTFSFIAQGAEVEVDKETGAVKVLRVVTANDCGQMINPLNVEGQIEGSVGGGLGFALYEELPHYEGRYLNPSPLEYLMPTAVDMPRELDSIPVDCRDPIGPFGSKDSGEGVLVPTAPAVANAVFNACGARINELPITPGKVLKALEEQGLPLPKI